MGKAVTNDAELVAESLVGNREAFRAIVERYQTLISTLAYSATGNLSQSEDLAQETFVSAWKQLGGLREPAKLRPWLCSIARFLIGKEIRRQRRQPDHAAAPLEAVDDWVAPEPLPPDQVISDEEKAILWRSLERIPVIYREPLMLFYREHQSIEAVADDLGLSEDAVKQRLSRGRRLLQEQFLAFVVGALQQTSPGKAFTLGVMAALPLLATSAAAATVTTAAAKGVSATPVASGAGIWSALLANGPLFALYGVFGVLGKWFGRKMGQVSQQTAGGSNRLVQFWRTLTIGFALFVLPLFVVPRLLPSSYLGLYRVLKWSLAAFCWLLVAALALWEWQLWRDAGRSETEAVGSTRDKSFKLWIVLGMAGPALFLMLLLLTVLSKDHAWSSKLIPESEARRIISERQDARFVLYQDKRGLEFLWIQLPENRRVRLRTPMSKSSLKSRLDGNKIAYETHIEGRNVHEGGFVVVGLTSGCIFILGAGTVLLRHRPGSELMGADQIEA